MASIHVRERRRGEICDHARPQRRRQETAYTQVRQSQTLAAYGQACGWALARARAKAGDALTIGGYLGSADVFDEAMGDFALADADQIERGHAALKAGVRAGAIDVHLEA